METVGIIIGLCSIGALVLSFVYADEISDGNIEGDDHDI